MLRQRYLTEHSENLLSAPGVLAVVSFEPSCASAGEPGLIPVGLTSLDGQNQELIEYGDGVAQRGADSGCEWSVIDDVICASTWVSNEECRDIEKAAYDAYLRLFELLADKGFEHPFRIWNFIPDINVGEGDSEEYKKFCVGRLRAFEELQVDDLQFPAASALGHHSQGAVIYLLASKQPGVHHENPRQERAYRYPRQYGPSSPSFSRATSRIVHAGKQIFVSGTASIVGHETCCPESLRDQLAITLDNIELLLESIAEQALAPLSAVRVYLRHSEHAQEARSYLAQRLPSSEVILVYADICRANLLVEIEASSCIEAS
jgi:chorismate lyase/3-hydroxybenzoate synthase